MCEPTALPRLHTARSGRRFAARGRRGAPVVHSGQHLLLARPGRVRSAGQPYDRRHPGSPVPVPGRFHGRTRHVSSGLALRVVDRSGVGDSPDRERSAHGVDGWPYVVGLGAATLVSAAGAVVARGRVRWALSAVAVAGGARVAGSALHPGRQADAPRAPAGPRPLARRRGSARRRGWRRTHGRRCSKARPPRSRAVR